MAISIGIQTISEEEWNATQSTESLKALEVFGIHAENGDVRSALAMLRGNKISLFYRTRESADGISKIEPMLEFCSALSGNQAKYVDVFLDSVRAFPAEQYPIELHMEII